MEEYWNKALNELNQYWRSENNYSSFTDLYNQALFGTWHMYDNNKGISKDNS